MVRKRYIALAWLVSFLSRGEENSGTTTAFQQPPFAIHKKDACHRTSTSYDIHAPALSMTESKKPLDTTSTSQPQFSTEDSAPKNTRRRKLNSDIYWLRNHKNGTQKAEKRLKEAVADMIEQSNHDAGDDIPCLLQKYQQQKEENENDRPSDERLDQWPDVVSFNAVMIAHAKNARHDRSAPKQALGLLEKMKELSSTFPHVSPNIFSYNTVIEAFCNQIERNQKKAGRQRQLQEDEQVVLGLYKELQEKGLSPTTYTRNMILASASKDSEEWSQLEAWAKSYLDGDIEEAIPDRKTYNAIFKIYYLAGDVTGAENLLQKLLKWYSSQDIDKDKLKPSKYWFHSILKALAASDLNSDESYQKLTQVLVGMKDAVKSGNADIQPDRLTYNHILNIYAKHGDPDLAVILMKEREEFTDEADMLDCISYTTVIKAFVSAQKKLEPSETEKSLEMAEKATEVFDRMREKSIRPTVYTYNTMINIWVNVGTRDAMKKAESFLRQIRYPDTVSYATLIHGWSKTRFPEAGTRAEKLYNEVLKLPSSRHRFHYSTSFLCNSVISAYAKSGDDDAPERVDSLLAQLEGRYLSGDVTARPDKITFLGIFDTYAKSEVSNAEQRCDILLDRMSHYRDMLDLEDLEPDRVVYNAVLNALAKSQQPSVVETVEDILAMMESSQDENLRPDIVTYATVIDCFTKCGERNLERADELLRFVEGTFRNGDEMLKPNAVFYSAVLQAWAKTGTIEGAEKAEKLLQRNIALYSQGNDYAKPHTIVFNAVMDAIARSNMVSAGPRAEELLDEMESLYQSGDEDMRPSKRSFNAVILAYRNQGNESQKAEELLHRMEDMAASGRSEVRPNVVSYNNAIAAVVEDTDSENTADRAQALLDQMEAVGIKPDGRTYSPVIEAWLRRNDEKGNALAEVMITQFLDNLEESKKQNARAKRESLYEDAVWNVISAYRDDSDNDFYSELASKGWLGGG